MLQWHTHMHIFRDSHYLSKPITVSIKPKSKLRACTYFTAADKKLNFIGMKQPLKRALIGNHVKATMECSKLQVYRFVEKKVGIEIDKFLNTQKYSTDIIIVFCMNAYQQQLQ